MKRNATILMMFAGAMAWSGFALAQAPAAVDANPASKAPAKAEPAKKLYHAGGRHDAKGHEAAVRAKESARPMQEPAQHPGGRHDETGHKAAIKAGEKAAGR